MSGWFYNFLQRARLRSLLLAAIILTCSFAAIYGLLHHFAPGNGLRARDGEQNIEWFDFIYFSVVTEATLGYGDFSPIGLSRAVSCLHVFLGVLLAGIAVARLTSAAINALPKSKIQSPECGSTSSMSPAEALGLGWRSSFPTAEQFFFAVQTTVERASWSTASVVDCFTMIGPSTWFFDTKTRTTKNHFSTDRRPSRLAIGGGASRTAFR